MKNSINQILVIAGEKSGEEHFLSLIDDFKKLLPQVHFFGVGGDEMARQGVELLYHLNDFSSWGLTEVVGKLPFYFKAMNCINLEVQKRNCRVALLIDFQEFNFYLSKKLKKNNVDVFYYVAPQAWGWRPGRAPILGKNIHTLFCILPFEKSWFADRGVKRAYSVPHPLYRTYHKALENYHRTTNDITQKETIHLLLLPGSRRMEVSHLLKIFLEAATQLKKELNLQVGIVPSPTIPEELFYPLQKSSLNVTKFNQNDLVKALKWADICFAASGTVTLSTALFSLPTIVCYKAGLFTSFVFYEFIKYKNYVSLANIVHQEKIFPELLQDEVSSFNIYQHALNLLTDRNLYEKMIRKLDKTLQLIKGDPISVAHHVSQVIRNEDSHNKTT